MSNETILMQPLTNGKPFVYPSGNIKPLGARMMSEKQHEWITTREAFPILQVTTTQGVWNVIERCKRYHDYEPRKRNIRTKESPQYLLNRDDVLQVAKLMGKTDDEL